MKLADIMRFVLILLTMFFLGCSECGDTAYIEDPDDIEEEDLSELSVIFNSFAIEPGKTNYQFFEEHSNRKGKRNE